MNNTIIAGKIIRINKTNKVSYVTIMSKTSDEAEFIPVTIFQNEFFNKYFHEDKWIGIRGHIHINKHNGEYKTEIIADEIFFIGDKQESWINGEESELLPY